ncbi:MAG: hypothetical protein A2138_11100 [Deltaproteobacteria bacterium RBG_16_71_12]|nr:MAG: hypothetical protein A2138_11100 [Deltaproteobacteria bacterium RBG_16_71_12]
MTFDPSRVPEDACVEGHLDGDAVYDVLLAVHAGRITGRLTVEDAAGKNHLFFMQGRPVGVSLAEYAHPLGQLLLELGRVNGQTFVRAQRRIAESNRLAGQVFKELGVLDEDGLREVLTTQARRKAEHFCRLGSRPFTFCRGLSFLSGFTSTPMDLFAVVYLAVRAQLGSDARAAWIERARGQQVRITNAPGDELGLPAPLAAFGFGAAEERFLHRIVGGWEKVADLVETGTLPPDEAALLLRYLEVLGRLERRASPAPSAVPAHVSALLRAPDPASLGAPEGSDDVFSSNDAPTPPVAAPGYAAPSHAARAPPAAPDSVFAGLGERTDPRMRSIHDQRTEPAGEAEPTPVNAPRPRFRSVMFPEQNAPPPPGQDAPAPVVKKKKVKRTEPLPSDTSGLRVSETRKEKTNVGPMPSIVIEDE